MRMDCRRWVVNDENGLPSMGPRSSMGRRWMLLASYRGNNYFFFCKSCRVRDPTLQGWYINADGGKITTDSDWSDSDDDEGGQMSKSEHNRRAAVGAMGDRWWWDEPFAVHVPNGGFRPPPGLDEPNVISMWWWDEPFAVHVVSYLCCGDLLRLTASNRYIKALRLERGLLTMRPINLSSTRLRQYFVDWAQQCNMLLDLDMSNDLMSRLCEPTDAVVQEIVGHYKHLLVIDLKECSFVTDQAVHAVARHCPSLIKITLGAGGPTEEPEISDAAVRSIAHYCRQLVCIDLDNTALTDDGAQALASSCQRLRYAAVGGTCVTQVGAIALATRITSTCEREGTHDKETTAICIEWPCFNLCLYRLDEEEIDRAFIQYMLRCFPRIRIFC